MISTKRIPMNTRPRRIFRSVALLAATIGTVVIASSCSQKRSMIEQFQAELDSLQAEYRFPGATAAYVLPDGTVQEFAVGMADVEGVVPMTTASRMLAASIGKTWVGAAVLALARDGQLDIDDPVSKWLGDRPWFGRLPNHDSITLRHLLNHTSGLPNHVESEQFAEAFKGRWKDTETTFAVEELVAFVLDEKPLFPAGAGWHYSDTGYLLLGLVIEKVTGQSWYDEVRIRFLEPLNLSRTTPSDRVDLPGLAAGYMSENNPFDLPSKTTAASGQMVWNPGIESSGGGFVSNSRDLAIWAKALYEGKAMPGDYVGTLLQSVPVSEGEANTSYGIGVAIHADGPFGPTYGHGGWIPGYSSSLRYYPDQGIAIAFQINTDVGIIDGSANIVEDMEMRLIGILAASENQ